MTFFVHTKYYFNQFSILVTRLITYIILLYLLILSLILCFGYISIIKDWIISKLKLNSYYSWLINFSINLTGPKDSLNSTLLAFTIIWR